MTFHAYYRAISRLLELMREAYAADQAKASGREIGDG